MTYEIDTNNMYMANASPNARVPSVTYIPLTMGLALGPGQLALGPRGFLGIGNVKCSRWGSCPTRAPNARRLAFWWNIGFSLCTHY